MRRLAIASAVLLALCFLASAIAGHRIGPSALHPFKAPLDSARMASVGEMLARAHAAREDFVVRTSDGVILRGWKIRSPNPNGDWVLLFHGVADNRAGTAVFAEFLLGAGYSVVMMDSRAQGESGGDLATFGRRERYDTFAVINALEASEKVRRVFAVGVSMGAAIALQSAAIDPRIAAVVAEAPFASLREINYDYAGLQRWPLLGMTLFRPASIEGLRSLAAAGGFDPDLVSPQAAVASRPFPVLLICGTADRTIPCRHAEKIRKAALGPAELWIVEGATHAAAFGHAPAEYARRVLGFLHQHEGE